MNQETVASNTMSQWIKFEEASSHGLPLPSYATEQSAAMDFSACLNKPLVEIVEGVKTETIPFANGQYNRILLKPGVVTLVSLGYKSEFSKENVLKLYVRSSVGLKGIVLANGTGIIDSDYRGEIFAALLNTTQKPIMIQHGDRIVQGILQKYERAIIEKGSINDTARGAGGFGSTGT